MRSLRLARFALPVLAALAAALPAGATCPEPPASPIAAILVPASGYVTAFLAVGDHYYTDRNSPGLHVIAALPPALACAQWIKTRNDDKNATSLSHLQFTLVQPATVYVGYDTRALSPPSWLGSAFTNTGLILDVTDPDPVQEFVLWKKDFPAGTVVLGGNKSAGAQFPLGQEGSNYVVAVTPSVASPVSLPFGPVQLDASTPFAFALDLEALPPRPVLRIAVDREDLPFGHVVTCSGPQGDEADFDANVNVDIPIYQVYRDASDREGVVCEVELSVAFGSGPYTLAIEASSPTPNTESSGDTLFDLSEVFTAEQLQDCEDGFQECRLFCGDFIPEGSNFRWIYDGSDATGTCAITSSPSNGVAFEYQQSQPGTGGWDCCTWRFDGVDGVVSEIGQIVLPNAGVPPPPDGDGDGILDPCDNCAGDPNGPVLGTCLAGNVGQACFDHADCGNGGDCDFDQRDTDADGIGDVCDTVPFPDADSDGVADASDNCPAIPNGPAQAAVAGVGNQTDSGGVGSPADPNGAGADGRGDACQCGDVNGDGKVLGNDATLIRRFLLNLSVPASFRVSHCNVAGVAGSTLAECQGNDATVIRRALLGLGPGVAPGLCVPAGP
jgi:hypothetical protein